MFHLYGLIVGFAVVVWWSMVERAEPRLKRFIPWILIVSLIGARAYHLIDEIDYYLLNPEQILMIWNGGLSIWGAVIAGMGNVWYIVNSKWHMASERGIIWSAVVTPIPLAQAIGRVANGVNGEFVNPVFGIPWWGMEALLDLLLFGVITRLKKEWKVVGYIVGYGLIRLVLQPYRM